MADRSQITGVLLKGPLASGDAGASGTQLFTSILPPHECQFLAGPLTAWPAASWRNPMTAPADMFPWASYTLDAWQRSVLFLDVLRERGNAFLEREDDPMRHVLSFDFDLVLDGHDLPK